jgi:hypothetical protein
MATKKSTWVLFGILVISSLVLGPAIQSGAETMKCKSVATITKEERISVSDQERHTLALQIGEGLAFCENGEIAKVRSHSLVDSQPSKGGQAIGYGIFTFDDGSTVVTRFQRLMVPDQSGGIAAKATSEIIKGTGRFEGIKGTSSSTGKNFLATKEEAMRTFSDFIWTYTLPSK